DGPWPSWRRLRRLSAPAYGAWLRLDERIVVQSNSPELYLAVDGREVVSLPIKGTRPRDAERDAELAAELLASPKEQAELTMIVDLVRNDLARVCEPGTIRAGARVVTPHANVHHAAQRVEGRLAAGRDLWDAFAHAFPPGSVTGAPKIRACQRIAELEDEPRGVYCGA